MFVTRRKIGASDPTILRDKLSADEFKVPGSDDHMGNSFDCVKTRRASLCDAETGHPSVAICHMGGLALALGCELTWDASKERDRRR